MRIFTAIGMLTASPAFGHVGHVASTAGHDHWPAVGAAALIVAIIACGWFRGWMKRAFMDSAAHDHLPDRSLR